MCRYTTLTKQISSNHLGYCRGIKHTVVAGTKDFSRLFLGFLLSARNAPSTLRLNSMFYVPVCQLLFLRDSEL